MTVTSASFRTDFPEFGDTTKFPDSSVNFWLNLGVKLLDPNVWGDVLDQALELFTAHSVSIAQRAFRSGSGGGMVGEMTGPTASKSIDRLSKSYNGSAGILLGAGHWNLTTYGVQFYQLAQMFGAGGIQL